MYCAQDFREYIGYKLVDVISNEIDCDAKLVLQNEETKEKVIIDGISAALDGETLFVSQEGTRR